MSGVEDWLGRVSAQASDLLDRALDRQVRLAVTGLSQSGKTAFITALVNQLEHACSPDARLPLWKACDRGRLLGVRRVPQLNAHIPSFAYEPACDRLFGAPPAWPESTRGVSEIRLEIRYRPAGRWAREIATLYLDIVDYPGEWLLDLPLLRLGYAQWSAEIARTLQQSPRMAALAQPWTQWNPSAADPFDEAAVARMAAAYTVWMRECREQLGLSLLQPGRFLLPGEYAGAPMLQFLPWVWGAIRERVRRAVSTHGWSTVTSSTCSIWCGVSTVSTSRVSTGRSYWWIVCTRLTAARSVSMTPAVPCSRSSGVSVTAKATCCSGSSGRA